MAKKIFCGNVECENNSGCGIVDVESGLCTLDDLHVGRSGFCLAASTVSRETIDRLEEAEGAGLDAQDEE